MSEEPSPPGSAAPSSSPPTGTPTSRSARHKDRDLRWLVGPALALLLVLVVRAVLVTPFSIPSTSMEDTLHVGDRILVTRTSSLEDIQRGDIIVFDASRAFNLDVPDKGLLERLGESLEGLVGQGPPTDYVKRVIGLPGDRVKCCAPDGRLEVNGAPIDEPYLKPGQQPSTLTFDVLVPPKRLWVMGDNRAHSSDSRAHLGEAGGGMVPGDDIIGKVWVRYWPLDQLGAIEPGDS
ncbi:signal peptidase I [Intrasporangium calvum]|uniref:Signal peptidase I n=1 Tax=Intrasporangium calvum TaxID=53358 RepID=A0ABT5GMI9_9MICO|nr:signal peptidase I [Intrasporangium calvum]MDC5699281.1 signal peptidase I [Intrasporangium calvum]